LISYIKGTVESISENSIIVENNGIGYNMRVSGNTLNKLSSGDTVVKIYTYMNVREDEISLFGFLSMEELDIFSRLISISGVGPKGALSLLSALSPSEIILAIITEDINALSKGQGIGKRIAQRIVLELRDRVKSFDYLEKSADIIENVTSDGFGNNEKKDAIEALISLGFGRSDSVRAVMEIKDDSLFSADIIKIALKNLSQK